LVPGKFLETDICIFIYRKGDCWDGWQMVKRQLVKGENTGWENERIYI
jgi:hypothetical protein